MFCRLTVRVFKKLANINIIIIQLAGISRKLATVRWTVKELKARFPAC